MKRWKAVVIVILIVISGIFVWYEVGTRRADRQHAADVERFDREIATLRHELPVGASRNAAREYAKRHDLQFSDAGNEDFIFFKSISSNVFYCSFWNAQARIILAIHLTGCGSKEHRAANSWRMLITGSWNRAS